MLRNTGRQLSRLLGDLMSSGREAVLKLLELPRNAKQSLLLGLDILFMLGAMWLGLAIRWGTWEPPVGLTDIACGVLASLLSAAVFLRLGLYRAVIRFMGHQAIWAVLRGVTISAAILTACMFFFMVVPRSLPLFYWAIALVLIGGSRLLVRAWYQSWLYHGSEKVLIYGAGASGRQLATALMQGEQYRAVGFVDDSPTLQGAVIHGLPVSSPGVIPTLIKRHGVTQILLAMPSVKRARRQQILDGLMGLPVHVRTVPRIQDLLNASAAVNELQELELDDLLGRDPVPPKRELLDRCITDKVVMVTGAGGSIGSELCRQILRSRPAELILFDSSEFALYEIERQLIELQRDSAEPVPVIALLGSVQNRQRLGEVFRAFSVQTVYHAAAYKHVPLVEHNIAEGVLNNVFGTWWSAVAAREAGVEAFVLISSDKAVRPSSVMGATKRFAEMLLQSLAGEPGATRFCMVRFGNVLGSSGSVVPLFSDQIRQGGPVTVTDPEVTRYFMSIPEAAQLVLQASAIGAGGEVFVLDMGDPVKIVDLARRMIRLAGYTVREPDEALASQRSDKVIAIRYIGLRAGEKLHEELLLGDRLISTDHPMIFKAEEIVPDLDDLQAGLVMLEQHCYQQNCESIIAYLRRVVDGFDGDSVPRDDLWRRLKCLNSRSDIEGMEALGKR